MRRRTPAVPLALLAALWSCRHSSPQPLPPPVVDLVGQADAAAEIVDGGALSAHTAALAARTGVESYLAAQLQRLGFAGAGPGGSFVLPYEKQLVVAAPVAPWVVSRGERKVSLGSHDYVAALGGRWARVRLHGGVPLELVPATLALPPQELARKVLVVLEPEAASALAPSAAGAISDVLRRAAALGAHAVVVLPRAGAVMPSPAQANQLAAGTGIPVAIWLAEPAARQLLTTLIATGLDYMPHLEGKPDMLPLQIGNLDQLAVDRQTAREPHHNLAAMIPGRDAAHGGAGETVLLVAPLPNLPAPAPPSLPASTGGAAQTHPPPRSPVQVPADSGALRVQVPADSRGPAAAAAEVLGVATAFQALSDPPRRTLVVAFTDPGADGLEGTRQLLRDPRWAGHVASALVLTRGNLAGPTQDIVLVGAQASPLLAVVAGAAALQRRRVAPDPLPGGATLWTTPAWALMQRGVPAVLLAPGTTPVPPPQAPGIVVAPAAAVTTTPPQLEGMVEDTRLAFRVAVELTEGPAAPRVVPQQVVATLRAAMPQPTPVPTPSSGRSRTPRAQRREASTIAIAGEAGRITVTAAEATPSPAPRPATTPTVAAPAPTPPQR